MLRYYDNVVGKRLEKVRGLESIITVLYYIDAI